MEPRHRPSDCSHDLPYSVGRPRRRGRGTVSAVAAHVDAHATFSIFLRLVVEVSPKMRQQAEREGMSLEAVPSRVQRGRRIRIAGFLTAQPTLQEIPMESLTTHGTRGEGPATGLRAFRVHGRALERDGARDGDHLIIASTDSPTQGVTVLAMVENRPMLRTFVGRDRDGRPILDGTSELLPLFNSAREYRILGVFVGMLRKRVMGSRAVHNEPAATTRSSPRDRGMLLRSQLDMLEAVRSETRNPRLQIALRAEAQRIRLLLQNGAVVN